MCFNATPTSNVMHNCDVIAVRVEAWCYETQKSVVSSNTLQQVFIEKSTLQRELECLSGYGYVAGWFSTTDYGSTGFFYRLGLGACLFPFLPGVSSSVELK